MNSSLLQNILNKEVLRARLGYVGLRLVGLLVGYCGQVSPGEPPLHFFYFLFFLFSVFEFYFNSNLNSFVCCRYLNI
jgi:hypothetical protein